MGEELFQHFASSERPFIEEALDWRDRVLEVYEPVLTGFLNPREQWIVQSLYGKTEDFNYGFFFGYPQAERQRLFLSPFYQEVRPEDFELAVFAVDYPKKFAHLTHGQIMGTILGEGLKTSCLGDIITDGSDWQFFLDREVSAYLQNQIQRIGRTAVKLEVLTLDQVLKPKNSWQETEGTVSSFRMDAILAEGFRLSRTKAREMVQSGLAKKNWLEVQDPSVEIREGDTLSLRHFGRLRLLERGSQTRKGRWRLRMGVLKS